MPWLGLGVFKMNGPNEAETAVQDALEFGYRSIDTAAAYNFKSFFRIRMRKEHVERRPLHSYNAAPLLRGFSIRCGIENFVVLHGFDYINITIFTYITSPIMS